MFDEIFRLDFYVDLARKEVVCFQMHECDSAKNNKSGSSQSSFSQATTGVGQTKFARVSALCRNPKPETETGTMCDGVGLELKWEVASIIASLSIISVDKTREKRDVNNSKLTRVTYFQSAYFLRAIN